MSLNHFRWGIIGPGKIARRFAAGLAHCSYPARVEAVASRSMDRALAFAAELDVPRSYGTYEELAADGSLDAVYIATPHSQHAQNALMCLEYGRSVLVEKPFTVNATEAARIIDKARARGLFCMEAMWTRFFPATAKLRTLVESGAVGAVRMVMADFGYRTEFRSHERLFNPELGGGGLLDVGIYPLSLACMLLGEPAAAVAQADVGSSGVDEAAAVVLRYPGGALAALSCATRVETPQQAVIIGEEGSITLKSSWWKPDALVLKASSGSVETLAFPYPGTGFQFEADEVHACIANGRRESAIMPLDESWMLMRVMDGLRMQMGVRYPADA